jgi:hypothetical protein
MCWNPLRTQSHITYQGDFMKHLMTLIAMGLALSFGAAHAADTSAAAACAAKAAEKKLAGAAKASFEKKCVADAGAAPAAMAASPACEKSAADKKLAGAAKSSYMKKCMADEKAGAAKPAASAKKTAQQERMKTCNAEAKDKKGDERKKFMSECLKAK